jgi:glyoxylase-like metal-dependent hydrolase (beta-lactamase superfamily II)
MLYVHSFTFNPFQENTYLLINDKKQCWIVDPGMYDNSETKPFIQYLTDNSLVPQSVINTHTHLDHIFGVQALKDKYQLPFGIHESDLPVLKNAKGAATMFGMNMGPVPLPDFFIQEGKLALGDDSIDVRFTPGHSPGSISFYYEPGNWVISGDALFSGSIGRTDLPGGDFNTLIHAIRTQLFSLPPDTRVFSGHGPATTIGYEQQHNPFLR